MSAEPERRILNGRPAINRAETARRARVSRSTADRWYRDRQANGHPEGLDSAGLWFDEDTWTQWHARFLTGKRAVLTEADYDGDPDELISVAEFARVLGYSDPAVIRNYLKLPGYLPEPDEIEQLPSGRLSRWWRREKAWQFARSRDKRGGGRPHGSRGRRSPRYESDVRLPVIREALRSDQPPTVAELAARLGVSERTVQRLVRAARDSRQ